MRLKSYFSATVEGAMAAARQELGPEAMLVNSRAASPEARHLGNYEVVFATELPAGREDASSAAAAVAGPASDRWSRELSDLKKEIEAMRSVLRRSSFLPGYRSHLPAGLADAYSALVSNEVAPELAREIVEAAEARVAGAKPGVSGASRRTGNAAEFDFGPALAQELESRIRVEPVLGASGASPRTVALVGPPGAGKTTTLVKLAVNYGLLSRRPVMLLSADNYRVAAAEQLRAYAAILGVGFEALQTVAALAQAIEENRGKDLILIDTPGLGPAEIEDSLGLAPFLSTRSDIDVQLVVPASMKPADLSRVVDAFDAFSPRRIIFTRLDETGSYGPVFTEAVRTGKPLSFFAAGQRIPEDLQTATAAQLVDLLLESHAGAHCNAA